MSKLIIYVTGRPLTHGHRMREFHWNEEHRCYLFQAKVFDDSDFNVAYEQAMARHVDMHPRVKLLAAEKAPDDLDESTPVSTITASREISLEEAEEVVRRLAPDRLKAKSGPKAKSVEATG